MGTVIAVFISALFFALIGTPAVRLLAFRLGWIDTPRADRAHRQPTAMLGGVAVYLGATAAVGLGGIVAWVLLGGWGNLKELAGILAGATLMSAAGLWDDHVRLRPAVKLLPQFAAAGLTIL